MGSWETLLDSFGAVVVAVLLPLVFLFLRRRWISRLGSTFECSVRSTGSRSASPAAVARGWTLGVGRYNDDELEWFRSFSFAPRPRYVFPRSIRVLGRRTPRGAEAFSLYAGHRVIDVELRDGQRVELAMSERALTGLLAWTEAAPPGHDRLNA